MRISVVTPVYNDLRVGRALESVLSQRHDADLELVVIDGASTDGTLGVLEGYRSRLTVLVSEPDRGIYDAMNKGIARATGDVVGVLNADDRYHDPFVLRDVLYAFQDPGVDACYGDLVYVDENDRVVRYWRSGPGRLAKFYLGWMPPHPTFFVRKRVYDRYGTFDTRYQIAADYELILRLMLKHRVQVSYINRVLVRMSIGGKSHPSPSNLLRANFEVFGAWQVNHLRFGYLAPLLKPIQKVPQYMRWPRWQNRSLL